MKTIFRIAALTMLPLSAVLAENEVQDRPCPPPPHHGGPGMGPMHDMSGTRPPRPEGENGKPPRGPEGGGKPHHPCGPGPRGGHGGPHEGTEMPQGGMQGEAPAAQ